MDDRPIVSCPKCNQQLRLPEQLGKLNLICKTCGHKFPWENRSKLASSPSHEQVTTIEDGLRRMRKRLLDLSLRNPLLNYRYPRGSKRFLRIIDELPNVLFEKLLDGKSLVFIPVPEPPRDELFSSATGDEEVTEPAEESGSPKRRRIQASEYAERLGINTNYDLPNSPTESSGSSKRHTDNQIQTLHYASEMLTILRKIEAAARTAIQESGVNMLYLAIGFLEWYESQDSEEAHLAPLVLVPVQIERQLPDADASDFRYLISYRDEDVSVNATLAEKL